MHIERALLVVLSLALWWPPDASAQPQIGGFVELDDISYFASPDRNKVNGRNQVILQPELRHNLGASADVFGSVELRYDQADPSRNRVYLDEAYIDVYTGPVDLRLGQQVYAWGRADSFNPTDFSARDFSDVLDTEDERLGLVSARATYYLGDWSLDAFLAPSFVASVLPAEDSRWWPALPASVPNPAYPQVGSPALRATYVFAKASLPDERFRNSQFGARLTGHAYGWDFSMSWFDGYDDLPALRLSPAPDPGFTSVTVTVMPTYRRRRTAGVDLATTAGPIGIHAEGAYYLTDDWNGRDPAIDDPYLQYVVGVDRTFDGALAGKDLFTLIEWIQEVQLPDRHTVYRITDLNHVFRKTLFGKADLRTSPFSEIVVEGFFNVASRDWYLRPGATWSPLDGLSLRVDVDVLGGPTGTFFGLYQQNDRLHARMRYSF